MKRKHKNMLQLLPKFKVFNIEKIDFGVDEFTEGNFRRVFETERFQEYYYTNFIINNSKFTFYFFTKTKTISITHYNTKPYYSFRTVNPQLHAIIFNHIFYLIEIFSKKYNTEIVFDSKLSPISSFFYGSLLAKDNLPKFCIDNNISFDGRSLKFE